MTRTAFTALLDRRDRLERAHAAACAILEEEGPDGAAYNYPRCVRLYAQLERVQEQIDAELDEERRAEEACDSKPAA